ncbi:hypothetical protein HWV62_41920 [Athelia sp. TMB]|nr:hypothetical protein HWV62_41920 [Athelia sp. TMB]
MPQVQRPSLVLQPSVNTTTVVTTTTTTTTYAPIQLPSLPSPSSPKDPKNYPLLHANLPKSLRRFPLVFPGGARATFRDGEDGEGQMQEEEEAIGGDGWRMLRRDEEAGDDKVIGLAEAVERYGRKRSYGGDNMMEGVESTDFELNTPPPRKKARAAPMPINTINAAAPPSPLPSPHGSPPPEMIWPSAPPSGASSPQNQAPFQPDLALTSLMTLPSLLSHFNGLPPQLQSHFLLTLLRHSPLPVLRTLHSVLTPTLARDFLNLLPPELVSHVLSFLPYSTLARASRVSKSWRAIIDSDPVLWRDLLKCTKICGSTDRTVRIWDLTTGRCTHVFGGHTSTVRCLAIVKPEWMDIEGPGGVITREKWPKRPLIVTGSRDHSLRVWALPRAGDAEYRCSVDTEGEQDHESADEDVADNPYHKLHLEGHDHAVRALAARGRTLVSGSYDCTVRIWDIITGECKWVLSGHTQKVYSVVLDPSRNQACSGSMDSTVRVWNLLTGECQYTLGGHTSLVGLLGLSPSYLVSAAADSTLRIWDPDTGELRHTLAAHTGAITCFQHDEFKVLSGSDGTLKMWNVRDGTVVRDLLTGITGVWQVVFEGRWCVAASNRNGNTVLDVWDFGNDNDDGWVGEPPGGMYDEDTEDEEEEDQADVDLMDQDLEAAPSEPESESAMSSARGRGEPDDDVESMDNDEGVEASRWAPSSTRPKASHHRHRNVLAGDANETSSRTGTSTSAMGESSRPRPLPTMEETPTRPRRCFLVEYVIHSPPILRINGDGTEPLNYSHTRGHAPKYRMFSVQERSRGECDEELGAYKRH